jgi:hypothetical protein
MGARLLSCDGVDAQALAARRVGDFSGRWNLQASRIHAGGEVLLEQGNPFVPTLRSCVFRVDGRQSAYALQWLPIDTATREARLADTRRSFRPANGWHTLAGGGYWITTSSFNADPATRNAQELTELAATCPGGRRTAAGTAGGAGRARQYRRCVALEHRAGPLIWGLQRGAHCVTSGRNGGRRRPTSRSCAASCRS